jgi:hypothetical protein
VERYGTIRQATDGNIIQRMRFACWMSKATDTHSEHVILIAAVLQQLSREVASVVRHTYVASHVLLYQTLSEFSLQVCLPATLRVY